jgi:hypothetical protein
MDGQKSTAAGAVALHLNFTSWRLNLHGRENDLAVFRKLSESHFKTDHKIISFQPAIL